MKNEWPLWWSFRFPIGHCCLLWPHIHVEWATSTSWGCSQLPLQSSWFSWRRHMHVHLKILTNVFPPASYQVATTLLLRQLKHTSANSDCVCWFLLPGGRPTGSETAVSKIELELWELAAYMTEAPAMNTIPRSTGGVWLWWLWIGRCTMFSFLLSKRKCAGVNEMCSTSEYFFDSVPSSRPPPSPPSHPHPTHNLLNAAVSNNLQ